MIIFFIRVNYVDIKESSFSWGLQRGTKSRMLFKCKFRGQRLVVRSIATATCIVPLIMSTAKLLDGCNNAFSLSHSCCAAGSESVWARAAYCARANCPNGAISRFRHCCLSVSAPFSFFSDSPTRSTHSKNTSPCSNPLHSNIFRMENIWKTYGKVSLTKPARFKTSFLDIESYVYI